MKKLLLTVAIIFAGIIASNAEENKGLEIVKRYSSELNFTKADLEKSGMLLEMGVEVQGVKTPVKIITKRVENKLRMETKMMGQDVLIIVNGDRAWVSAMGETHPIPSEQIDQFMKQTKILDGFLIDETMMNIEYVGEEGDFDMVKVTDKESGNSSLCKFDKTTGHMVEVDTKQSDLDVKTTLSEYKKFGNMTIPSVITVSVSGTVTQKITINEVRLNYMTAAFLFAEPV